MPLIALALQLAPLAPQLLRWLTGDDPGPIAKKVLDVAQAAAGAATPEEAVKAVLTEPDKQRAFTAAIQEHAEDLERAYLADRQDARKRDLGVIASMGRNRRGDNLAYLAAFALLASIVCLFLPITIPEANEKLLYLAIGALIVIVKDVYGFEFGSSKNSERSAQALADYLQKNGN